ncbi:daptide-type RiPP [Paenibacillus tritici]|nr:daptide-type RiPP [Paenibacillus tritici]
MEELEAMEAPMEWYYGVLATIAVGGTGVAVGYGVAAAIAFT